MPTTAEYRRLAISAEDELDWEKAAHLFDKAIQSYPTRSGELAKNDLQMLTTRRDANRNMMRF